MNAKWNLRLVDLTEDWKYYYRAFSWKHSIPLIFKEILESPEHHIHYLVFVRSLTGPLAEMYVDDSIAIRRLASRDIPEVAVINCPSEGKLCANRRANDHISLAALLNAKLAGYAWACIKIEPHIERFAFRLEPLEFLCNDDFTAAPSRGRGIQTSLIQARLKIFCELGYKNAICYIEQRNYASQRAYRKNGFVRAGDINFFRIDTWRRARVHLTTSSPIRGDQQEPVSRYNDINCPPPAEPLI